MCDDWREEAYARFLESHKRTEAELSQRRAERGEFTVYLEPGPIEPAVSDPGIQEELTAFGGRLRDEEVVFNQRALALDAVDAHGYPLAEFIIKEGAPVVTAVVGGVAGWLAARAGRKVRIKAGEFEAEAETPEEAERLLKIAVETVTTARKDRES